MFDKDSVNQSPITSLCLYFVFLFIILCLPAYFFHDSVIMRIIATTGAIASVICTVVAGNVEKGNQHRQAPNVKRMLGLLELSAALAFFVISVLVVKFMFLGYGIDESIYGIFVSLLGFVFLLRYGLMTFCQGVLDVADKKAAYRSFRKIRFLVFVLCICTLVWGTMSGIHEYRYRAKQRNEAINLLQIGEKLLNAQPSAGGDGKPAPQP